jgi:hypothetical protein
MFLIGDLVYCGKFLKDIGVVVDTFPHSKIFKYKVHFLESNFVWEYAEYELTKVSNNV